MANKNFYMPLYWQLLMGDKHVRAMSDRAFRAYMKLMHVAWEQEEPVGTLPAEDATLARYAEMPLRTWMQTRGEVEKCFRTNGSRWEQKKMMEVHKESETKQMSASEHGRAGALARWGKHTSGNAQGMPEHNASNAGGMAVKVKDKVSSTEESVPCAEDAIAHGAREVSWPKLEHVMAWGKMDGISDEQCKKFFNHFEGLGWMNGKTPIINPRSFLQNWRSPSPKGNPVSGNFSEKKSAASQMFVWREQAAALEKLIASHPANETASGYSEDRVTPEMRADLRKKKRDLQILREKMAGGGDNQEGKK